MRLLWMKWKYYVGFTMVKAGALKNIAVQSPRGNLATASNIPRRRKPPRTPWAATLHLVAKSGVPRMWCLPQMMMGSIDNNWETHRTNRSCQEFTSGMYFTITLLEQENNRQVLKIIIDLETLWRSWDSWRLGDLWRFFYHWKSWTPCDLLSIKDMNHCIEDHKTN